MRTIVFLVIALASLSARSQFLFRANSGTTETLFTISMMDDNNGIVAGAHQALAVTHSAGERWTATSLFGPANFYASYFNDSTSGAIVGDGGAMLVKLPGAGQIIVNLPERKTIRSITYPTSDTVANPKIALCVGDSGLIYRSIDSGKSWSRIDPPKLVAERNFYGLTYWDDSTYWIVGAGGIVLYTEDAGSTWQRIPVQTQKDLYSIAFPSDGSTGWIVGDETMLYTTDYGDTWTSISTTANLRAVDGYDSTGFAVGLNGTLLATNDLTHWVPIETGTTANLYGMAITNDIYIVGDTGIVLTTLAALENSVAAETAKSAGVISSNGRTISFQDGDVRPMTIEIYDLLGTERGRVEMTGGSAVLPLPLPSGVYLYHTGVGRSGKFLVR